LRLAREHDPVIELHRRPGHFVIAGRPLMRAWPAARVSAQVVEAAADQVVLGPKRTPTEDVDSSIDALVEIAVRALSPGINDPRTAMTCIDRLATALAHFIRSGESSPLIYDQDGTLRLITNPTTFHDALGASFNQIRQVANGHVSVLIRMIDGLTELAEIAPTDRPRMALARHAAMVRRTCRRSITEHEDRADAERRLHRLDGVLAERPESDAGTQAPLA
jgi:uncharacterized membrane protein